MRLLNRDVLRLKWDRERDLLLDNSGASRSKARVDEMNSSNTSYGFVAELWAFYACAQEILAAPDDPGVRKSWARF